MKKKNKIKRQRKILKDYKLNQDEENGFTLLEVLMVIGIIAILAGMALVAVNPTRQFKNARDGQRLSNVSSILNAVGQNMIENRGIFTCASGGIPTSPAFIESGGAAGTYDIAPCLVPDYLSSLPFDPSVSLAHYTSPTDYKTGYVIYQDSLGRITASSTGELSPSISATR